MCPIRTQIAANHMLPRWVWGWQWLVDSTECLVIFRPLKSELLICSETTGVAGCHTRLERDERFCVHQSYSSMFRKRFNLIGSLVGNFLFCWCFASSWVRFALLRSSRTMSRESGCCLSASVIRSGGCLWHAPRKTPTENKKGLQFIKRLSVRIHES